MLKNTYFDVVIVGAGPAGTTAAITCAKHNLSVALIEKCDHPRTKVCGGGLVKRAYDACPVNIEHLVEEKITNINFVWHLSKFTITDKSVDPAIYMVKRKKFDAYLHKSALDLGVKYYPNTKLIKITQTANEAVVRTNNGHELRCLWLIGADGASGTTAKLAGWASNSNHHAPAIDAEIVLAKEKAEKLNHTRFDFEIIPRGYGWVFPKHGSFSIGVGGFYQKKNKTSLQHYLKVYLDLLEIKDEDIVEIKKKGFVIPLRFRKEGVVNNRVLLVGDAAGLADPLTAEGISVALITGRMAADAIINETQKITAGQIYQQKIDKKICNNLLVSNQLSTIFYKYPRLSKYLIKFNKNKITKYVTKIFSGEKQFSDINLKSSWRRKLFYLLIMKRDKSETISF